MTYRFDPELAPWVPMLPQLDISDVAAARATLAEMAGQAPAYESPVPLTVTDLTVPGPEGAPDVAVRTYSPVSPGGADSPASSGRARPALLYIHGGGFILGSVASEDARARQLAAATDAVVMSVDYRLPPHHPLPPPPRDRYPPPTPP